MNKIIAHNLTAKAAYNVPGNPPATRPESGVANCYPGLEYDHRNLDRRFMPGLIFQFVSQGDAAAPDAARQGALLQSVDTSDPGLSGADGFADLASDLADALGSASDALGTGQWFLSSITQAGVTIALQNDQGTALDGAVVWRLVRSLRKGPVSVELRQRGANAATPVTLAGFRRQYMADASGSLSAVYAAGELTQSLCSPWMHDFRDCGCTYWASNHPDIVLTAAALEEDVLPSGAPGAAIRSDLRVDWLRADRSVAASAQVGARAPTALQMSHFEINRGWQDLAVVLEGREIESIYVPRTRQADNARPYATPAALRAALEELAGLEHLVCLLYLYARYSIIDVARAQAEAQKHGRYFVDDVEFSRHVLLEVAVSEMQHLRWVNHILWGLFEARLIPEWTHFEPALTPASHVSAAGAQTQDWPATLEPLTRETLQRFLAIEQPSGFIDGRYARATATLLSAIYPPKLHELASTIVRDGEQHYLRFLDIQKVLSVYAEADYLRPIKLGKAHEPDVAKTLEIYRRIVAELETGYQMGSVQNMEALAEARQDMFKLDAQLEQLAQRNLGVPLLDWPLPVR